MSKQKKYYFIYKTTNVLTGRYYYGMHSTYNLDDGYLGSGKRLRYSIRKYGEENHKREIIEFVNSREMLKQREREIVNINEIAKKDCMNLIVGGEGGFISKEQQKYRSSCAGKAFANRLKNDVEFRNRFSENTSIIMKQQYKDGRRKKGIFCDWTGRKHKEESKRKTGEKNSIHQKGSGNSQYGTCWIYKDKENKKIKKENLDKYLIQGWIKGRKM